MDGPRVPTTPGAAAMGAGVEEDTQLWLQEFARRKGRPLRVLHVGNIANNAYLNAKFLRCAGVDAHVLCHEYYHIMGCPEFEDADFEGDPGDDFNPHWRRVNLHGFVRPRWFVQGPLYLCARYLTALNAGQRVRSETYWRLLDRVPRQRALYRSAKVIAILLRAPLCGMRASDEFLVDHLIERLWKIAELRKARHLRVAALAGRLRRAAYGAGMAHAGQLRRLTTLFRERFPERPDVLTPADFSDYLIDLDVFRQLFAQYDIVQCYSTDPILALLAGTAPYVAFEHGTLRVFTLGDDPLHRLTSLAYREAAHCFITNGDCLEYAQKLGITRYSPMIHPVNVPQHEQDLGDAPTRIRRELGADVLLLCPLRHDWVVKGTDIHLRALPLVRRNVSGRVVLLLTEWGAQVRESKALLRELHCDDAVRWIPPVPRPALLRYTKAADVVLDQMALPCFGSTAPQALAAGTPVIMSYRPESTAWILNEPAPILAAFTPEDVARSVQQALDPGFRSEFRKRAHDWTHREHGVDRVVRTHLGVYRRILDPQAAQRTGEDGSGSTAAPRRSQGLDRVDLPRAG
jgi:glycosyltransferase involved in cell wall biosynthesis